ncbi:related to THI21 - Hydroxymethylpyrimidine phosphate kinase, involved in the last steps in thiamine biosynthesis [Melanopsichium pennsylvanicum]|uniref:Related to THI21 - Hydroxymethylpyrimidine phosphate kinase, involved in the last steps in thiamine biosynthesis n=2 Tax=Melanopsichium pennsylvanicum TaxID=63383 RepID=A0AAJ4XPD3_9BASI|nr:related to THI21-Hydroxymethylpyrimidine phosphate kinase, involved in the last steps in thiamine biosynthesis [Melanopsichium pennsylvanicum 4]SNX86059.1 related to THI21 - Hydroxymethylpyrimidine phosphate kinase, involved in the last steps in thiamine biosynthesis [Melanopsichium pennsylvanicum]
MSPPRVLTIAGSDSSGGAGIQADLKTFLSLGTYGLSVLTALTAQNTTGVSSIHACPTEFVLQQFDSVASDIQIDAIKMGMLSSHEIVAALASRLRGWTQSTDTHGGNNVPLVLDPVMVSTSGSLLLSEDAIETLIRDLLPLCTILTPNLPEARQLLKYAAKLTSHQSGSQDLELAQNNQDTELPQMMAAAKSISNLGPQAVLVKGGHAKLRRSQIEDYLERLHPKADIRYIAPAALPKQASTSRDRYPQRKVERSRKARPVDLEDDLRQLAGVDGAVITLHGNVTMIRTDIVPFSEVLDGIRARPVDKMVVCDVLYQQTAETQGSFVLFVKPLIDSSATHGTGCTLSSALAASLAQGYSLIRSTSIAITYVQNAIANGIQDLGAGPGPLDHSYPFQSRGLITDARLSKNTRALPNALMRSLISNSIATWTAFVQHPFVFGLANGSLSREAFEWFMKQDYLFLRHYARIWAQAAASPDNTFEEISTLAEMAQAMAEEAKLHLQLCKESFGIPAQELEHETMESAATLAYTRFVLDTARSSDSLDLLVAVSPCMVGYAQVGLWAAQNREQNIKKDYIAWIEAYARDEFQSVVQRAVRLVEAKAARDPPSPERLRKLQKIWNAACRLEAGMWDEAIETHLRKLVLEP